MPVEMACKRRAKCFGVTTGLAGSQWPDRARLAIHALHVTGDIPPRQRARATHRRYCSRPHRLAIEDRGRRFAIGLRADVYTFQLHNFENRNSHSLHIVHITQLLRDLNPGPTASCGLSHRIRLSISQN